MTKTTADSVESQVRRLAKAHKVTAELDDLSRMAVVISQLSGDDIELDDVEQLLVNLKKKGVLSTPEVLTLQGRYLEEKRRFKNS